MMMCLVYYGISFALGSLGGSLYLSFAIGAAAEVGAGGAAVVCQGPC
jgi:hypothetical protein